MFTFGTCCGKPMPVSRETGKLIASCGCGLSVRVEAEVLSTPRKLSVEEALAFGVCRDKEGLRKACEKREAEAKADAEKAEKPAKK